MGGLRRGLAMFARWAGLGALGYGVACQLGLLFKHADLPFALFWPAAGVGAALLTLAMSASRAAVALGVGAVAVTNVTLNLWAGSSLAQSAGFATANIVESLVVAATLTHLRRRCGTARHSVPGLLVAGLSGVAASTCVALPLLLPGLDASTVQVALSWAVSDLAGILVVGSLLVAPHGVPPGRRVEATLQTGATVLLCAVAYWFTTGLPITWLPLAALTWSAMRLGTTWTAISSALASLLLALGTGQGRGPYSVSITADGLGPPGWELQLSAQAFTAFAVVSTMTVAVVVAERERVAHELAMIDPLTGLANRLFLTEQAPHVISDDRTGHRSTALIYCDVNAFKEINDRFGHAFGDHVLFTVAEHLRGRVRSTDLVARLGGDEFVILCADVKDCHDLVRLQHALGDTLTVTAPDGSPLAIGIAVGCATGGPETSLAQLLDQADQDMYRHKPSHHLAPGTE